MTRQILLLLCFLVLTSTACGQELNAKVVINHQQVANTKTEMFETLETQLTQMLNERQWTNQQYRESERIACNFNITVTKYDDTNNQYECTLLLTSSRPVYNSSYTTTVYSVKDPNFNFQFQQFDQLEYRPEQVDNNLVALIAYYVYVIIGMDMDTMAPMGGTELLHSAEDIVTQAQSLGYAGWKAFDDSKNRFGLLNDYLDGAMEPYRQLQYKYYREGLDHMAENSDEARSAITEALGLLDQAHKAKSMSQLPQLFTEYKRDELVNIYSGKGTAAEREEIYNILFGINASQSNYWDKLKK